MEFLSSLFYFIIVIGLLVFIHEFGHFLAARISKMRVDIFAIGMGYRLCGWNTKTGFTFGPLPKDYVEDGRCDYRLCAFPIGGYCKIAGMIDESMDTDFVQSEPQPWEFRSKNAFLKGFTISAGVIMNTLLAIVVFAVIGFTQGASFNGTTTLGYVAEKSVAEKIGLIAGDKILAVDGHRVSTWEEMLEKLAVDNFGKSKTLVVKRTSGEKLHIKASGKLLLKALTGEKPLGITPNNSFVMLAGVETLKPAGKAGLLENDTIVSVNGTPIRSVAQFQSVIKSHKEKAIVIDYKRSSALKSASVTPDGTGLIGVAISEGFSGKAIHRSYGIGESITIGVNECVSSVKMFFNTFSQIFAGNMSVKQSLGGPILIAKSAAQRADMGFLSFMHFVGMLSISLAIVNILPIPALDGGHLLFIIIEAIIRREVPVKFKMVVQQAGIFFVMALMVLMFYNDIARIFGF